MAQQGLMAMVCKLGLLVDSDSVELLSPLWRVKLGACGMFHQRTRIPIFKSASARDEMAIDGDSNSERERDHEDGC